MGGDYYDFIPFGNDVFGKGVSADLQIARLMSDFRYISQFNPEPKKVLKQINKILCERSYRGMFTTAVFCLLDTNKRTLTVANGGHLSLLLKNEKNIEEIGHVGGTPLGILPNVEYTQNEYSLKKEDQILIYTDGITEPKNKQQEEFGVTQLKELFTNHDGSPQEFIQLLKISIKNFIGDVPQFDDLISLAFKVI